MPSRDFYTIQHEGETLELPRVTSILRIVDKSGPLMGWAVNCERRAFQAALEEVLTRPSVHSDQDIYEQVTAAVTGKRAWVRESDKSRDIGSQAHMLIEWHVHKMLGIDPGEEPKVSDAALRAVVGFLDWCAEVDFVPTHTEMVVYCPFCAYAGTFDCIAKVTIQKPKPLPRMVMLIDWKTGKAVYPEAFLQNISYRHAALRDGIKTDGGLIVRLPKTAEDPSFEAVPVPPMSFRYFQAAKMLWMWQREMEQDYYGPQMKRCTVEAAR